jgi:hypothetical protein
VRPGKYDRKHQFLIKGAEFRELKELDWQNRSGWIVVSSGTKENGPWNRIVSCTLPFSPKVVYGHSYCMEKSLLAVATLFKPSFGSLSWTERMAGIEFWAGSYKTKSAFTTRFQVLPPEIDCHQRRIFMVRFDPEPGSRSPRKVAPEIEELFRFVDSPCTAAFVGVYGKIPKFRRRRRSLKRPPAEDWKSAPPKLRAASST